MRRNAFADEFSPVVALVGPTASSKTALVREFAPEVEPVVGFSGQPLPTTSNVNYMRAPAPADNMSWNGIPAVRFLDMEGEDGGLPLTQLYSGAKGVPAASAELNKPIEIDDALRDSRTAMSMVKF